MIDAEHRNGRPPRLRQSHQDGVGPSKMPVPVLAPWMKQTSDRARIGIDAGQIRPLAQIAARATQAQVVSVVTAAMLFGNDVFDVKTNEGHGFLVHTTVDGVGEVS